MTAESLARGEDGARQWKARSQLTSDRGATAPTRKHITFAAISTSATVRKTHVAGLRSLPAGHAGARRASRNGALRCLSPSRPEPHMTDILSFDGAALLAAYRKRTLSPREVVDAALAAIERFNPALNAFCIVDAAAARSAARESEARWAKGAPKGIADGLPLTIKDNLYWTGHPMRRGSKTSADTAVPENAPAVDRLIETGAIPLGKTTMPEYGWKGLGDSPLHGPARNPWDTSCTPGGSSPGASRAAALNPGVLPLGTDGAGSIRIPGSCSGVYGIKPSWGRVPAFPPSPFGIVPHVGPPTRTGRAAALMLGLIGAPDARDMTAMNTPAPDYRVGLEDGVRGLRIAWSPRLGYVERLDPEVEALTAQAARVFEELGATVEQADPGF